LNVSRNNSVALVLPFVHALAETNICYLKGDLLRVKPLLPDGFFGATCSSLSKTPHNFLNERSFFGSQGGVVHSSSESRLVNESLGSHKYCTTIKKGKLSSYESERIKGLSILLSEAHGSGNIGHSVRDLLFLARILRLRDHPFMLTPRHVIIRDPLKTDKIYQYRRTAVHALTSGIIPVEDLHFLNMRNKSEEYLGSWARDGARCLDLIVQKVLTWPGDSFDAEFYRQRAVEFCGLDARSLPSKLCIEVHDRTREWANVSELSKYLLGHHAMPQLEGLIVVNFAKQSYCDQIRIMRSCRIFVAHHGAAVAGNGVFMSNNSLIIEISGSHDKKTGDALSPLGKTSINQALFQSIGSNYLGARVAYATVRGGANKRCPYDYSNNAQCVLRVEYESLGVVLDEVRHFFPVRS